MLLADQMGVDESLQIVITVVLQALLLEDGFNIGQGLWRFAACLVVDDADTLLTVLDDTVQTVNTAADGCRDVWCLQRTFDIAFQTDDGERSQRMVNTEQLPQIVNNDFAVDDLYASGDGQIG